MKTAEQKAEDICRDWKFRLRGPEYVAIKKAILEQDRDTRHACAESVAALGAGQRTSGGISSTDAHDLCMNVKAV